MFGASKLVALILAFVLGFSCCAGVLVGGFAIAMSSFTVRDVEKYGIADIPDELFMGENPEVDLLDLTAFEFIDELKTLYAMDTELTINVLQKRYDLKIPPSAEKFLTDETREMPIKALFSEDGVKSLLSTVYIGYVQGFECHALDSTEPADPALGKEGARWYNTNGEYLTGIDETLAFISLGSVVEGNLSVQGLLDDIVIGDVMGYQQDENGDWYKIGENYQREYADGLIGAFVGCTISDVPEKFNDLKVGDVLGYEKDEDGKWFSIDENGEKKYAEGTIAFLADAYINDIGPKLENATIGELIGYTYDEEADKWYTLDESTDPATKEYATGVMSILAGCKMDGSAGDAINEAYIGDLMGYQKIDGVWCDELGEPLSGFMGKIADSSLVADKDGKGGIGDVFDTITVGDLVEEKDRTGIFAILKPETPINGIAGEINDSIMGSPMQFFMNEGLISFENKDPDSSDPSTADILDGISVVEEDYTLISASNPDYAKYYEGNGTWAKDGDNYKIPTWRTKPLNESFSYIVLLLSGQS